MKKVFFITGTDTGVGKTIVTAALGLLLQKQGFNVGVLKPVQCAGQDAAFLKKTLQIKDSLREINPFYAPEPLSPHVAFSRQKKKINPREIIRQAQALQSRYDILLIEGAGGLMVPLTQKYLVADLIRDLDAPAVIVSRLGLGTINHTLLTVEQTRAKGIHVTGIIFNGAKKSKNGIPEKTNPASIKRLSRVPILGIVPHLKKLNPSTLSQVQINLKPLLTTYHPPKLCFGETSPNCLTNLAGLPLTTHDHLISSDKSYIWHPFTQMKDWLKDDPLVIDRAQGNYLIDTQGRKYIDGVSSLWVNVHGHRKKEIDEAVKKQIDRVSHSTFLGLSNTPAIELAKELVAIAPKGLKKVFYSDNGSTAVEVAVKMAYQYWRNTGRGKKTGIVHLENSYHGDTLGSVSIGGIDLFHNVYRGLIFKTIALKGNGWETVTELEELLKKKSDLIATLVVEPLVQGAAGMIVWPQRVLKRMRALCTKYDVFLIADEVATGFGRTGRMFACEHERVTPDFLCLAKGLTGGYLPLAATLTTQRVYDGFMFDYKDQKTFFHGHTYTGNPLACAAALANLNIFRQEHTLARLVPKIKYLAKRLKIFYNLPSVGDVRQCGLMVGIEIVRDRKTRKPYSLEKKIGARICQELRKHGIILRPLGNTIVLMPPLSITNEELEHILTSLYKVIKKITS